MPDIDNLDAADFFRGDELIDDPYPYYEHLRSRCPVAREPHHGVVMVTGYEEAVTIYNDPARFSSCNAVTGPFPGFPVPLTGDDVAADDVSTLIDAHRDALPFSDQLPTFDPPLHTDHRALLMRLITPKRLKENEAFMWRLADQQIDEFLASSDREYIAGFAQPFAMLVVADLLGVPEHDHDRFREGLAVGRRNTGSLGSLDDDGLKHSPLEFLYEQFTAYIDDRRQAPSDDVMTGLATAKFPDGSTPEVIDVVRIAANLFAAGQETSVRMLAASLQLIGERPELQQALRDDRSLVPNFVEESLRIESPVKGDFRLSRVATTIGGVDVPAGSTIMLVNAAANRDPRRYECPADFDATRANARSHLAFGHGAHTCPGAPLARAEGRVAVERLLDRTRDIRVSELHHGPADTRRYEYAPTYILRGLRRLYLDLDLEVDGE